MQINIANIRACIYSKQTYTHAYIHIANIHACIYTCALTMSFINGPLAAEGKRVDNL